jgi:preprotein translocase subunit SecY
MWLGERITDRGIGQGISMLIMIGIVSRFPAAIIQEGQTRGMNGALFFVLEIAALFFVVMGVVLLTQAVRRIPVQYAKQVVGNKVYGGQRQYIPLKVNAVGVMPIIFAQSLMFLPSILAGAFQNSSDTAGSISQTFSNPNSLIYNVVFALMIIIFTYFYTAISINPKQIADDMKRNNGFVPGVQPGEPTAEYIDNILSRVTLPGALFLALIAVLPAIVGSMGVTQGFAAFFGGTSLLIMVSVVLDTLQQIESYLLMKHYEGLMETGNLTEGEKATTAVV